MLTEYLYVRVCSSRLISFLGEHWWLGSVWNGRSVAFSHGNVILPDPLEGELSRLKLCGISFVRPMRFCQADCFSAVLTWLDKILELDLMMIEILFKFDLMVGRMGLEQV